MASHEAPHEPATSAVLARAARPDPARRPRRAAGRDHPGGRRRAARRAPALLLASGLALAAGAGAARAGGLAPALPEASRVAELKVLTYNVKALPVLTNLERLERIGEILAERRRRGDEPDVVVLQEAFVERARALRRRAGYPYAIAGLPEQKGIFANGSGLEVLSNHPILETYGRSFDDCAFPECLVSKSILGVTIRYPDLPEPVQIFTTHLQADGRNDRIRRNQIDDIAVFLDRISFGRQLAIFAGDFNFKPRHPSYRKFLKELPVVDVGPTCLAARERAEDACEILVGADGRTDWRDVSKTAHDRQFYYQPEASSVRIEPIRVIRSFTEKVDGRFLSDHWGYEVHYRIRW